MATTSGISAAELAKVLASIGAPAEAPAPALPVVAPVRPPAVDLRPVQRAEGAALAEALGDPAAPQWPRHEVSPSPYRCRVCGGEMDAFHAAVGTHPACDPEPAPVQPPPSTLGDLAEVLVEYERRSDRSQQAEIGPSELAVPCQRRLAYRLRNTPEIGGGCVPWAPLQGTAMHTLIADALKADNERLGRQRWIVEREVWPDPTIKGHADVLDTDTMTVIDWKLTGKTRLNKYKRHGPGLQYEGQIQLYGLGYQRAGFPVRFVRIAFLARTSFFDESHEYTAPYSRSTAERVLDRMYATIALLHDLSVDADPTAWDRVPALASDDCRYCPFYRRGGPADAAGCPGDVAADARRDAKFNEGLIA